MSLEVNPWLPGRTTSKHARDELSILQTLREHHSSHNGPFGGRERGDINVFITDYLLDHLYINNDLGWLGCVRKKRGPSLCL